ELGAFAVVGVLCLAVTTLLLVPAALALQSVERVARRAKSGTPLLDRLLGALARTAARVPRRIFALALVLAVVSLWGLRRIEVDSDFLHFFSPGAKVRTDNETINQQIVGANLFSIIVEGEPGALRRWEVLRRMKDLETYIRTLPGIPSTISLVDMLGLVQSGTENEGDWIVPENGPPVPAPPPKSVWEEPRQLKPLLRTIVKFP